MRWPTVARARAPKGHLLVPTACSAGPAHSQQLHLRAHPSHLRAPKDWIVELDEARPRPYVTCSTRLPMIGRPQRQATHELRSRLSRASSPSSPPVPFVELLCRLPFPLSFSLLVPARQPQTPIWRHTDFLFRRYGKHFHSVPYNPYHSNTNHPLACPFFLSSARLFPTSVSPAVRSGPSSCWATLGAASLDALSTQPFP